MVSSHLNICFEFSEELPSRKLALRGMVPYGGGSNQYYTDLRVKSKYLIN